MLKPISLRASFYEWWGTNNDIYLLINDKDTKNLTIKKYHQYYEDLNIEAFVKRLYENILERDANEAGLHFWTNKLIEGESAARVIKSFILSKEFTDKNSTNEAFVTILYKTLVEREPDAAGFEFWIKDLEKLKRTRVQEMYDFAYSQEFNELANRYHIVATDFSDSDSYARLIALKEYLLNFYDVVVLIKPNDIEFNHWITELLTFRKKAKDFVSYMYQRDEYKNRTLSDEEYIMLLYSSILYRAPDPRGKNIWLNALKHTSKENVRNGIVESVEFNNKCLFYHIKR